MNKQTTVKIQCKNRILLKAILELLERTPKIQIVQNLPEQEHTEPDCTEFVVREEDDFLRQWESSLDPNGKIHMYIHPSDNCITLTMHSRIALGDVAELAELIVFHQEHCLIENFREENHKRASPTERQPSMDTGKDVEK